MPERSAQRAYELVSHSPVVDDPEWWICTFKDPAAGDVGGLTVTVSEATLQRLTSGDLSRPLTEGAVMALDGT